MIPEFQGNDISAGPEGVSRNHQRNDILAVGEFLLHEEFSVDLDFYPLGIFPIPAPVGKPKRRIEEKAEVEISGSQLIELKTHFFLADSSPLFKIIDFRSQAAEENEAPFSFRGFFG